MTKRESTEQKVIHPFKYLHIQVNAAAIVNPSTSIVVEYLQEDLYEVSTNEYVTKG